MVYFEMFVNYTYMTFQNCFSDLPSMSKVGGPTYVGESVNIYISL